MSETIEDAFATPRDVALPCPTFSVIIAAYSLERWEDLCDAVRSVAAQHYPALETIVAVDDNPELLSRARTELPGVRVVENDRFPGAGGARNAGAAIARGDVLAFIDDDVQATPEWLQIARLAFADPTVIGGGGRITPRWLTGRPWWFPVEFDWVVGCTFRGTPEHPAAVRNVIAANMTIRRDRFEELGGFRRDFGKVGARSAPEETDLCIRAGRRWRERSWRFLPDAEVHHNVPRARTTWRYYVRRCWWEGRGKAELAALVGVKDGTRDERRYVRVVLPRGIARYLRAVPQRRSLAPLGQATALLVGLAVTAVGYVIGRVAVLRRRDQ
jgi:glycosyltransferase involved in cell wall biosynthesis